VTEVSRGNVHNEMEGEVEASRLRRVFVVNSFSMSKLTLMKERVSLW
jgi:hypothetical protein